MIVNTNSRCTAAFGGKAFATKRRVVNAVCQKMAGFNVQKTAAIVEIQEKIGLTYCDILSLALIKSRTIRAKRRDKTEVRLLQKIPDCCM
jgi:hypothetical protein